MQSKHTLVLRKQASMRYERASASVGVLSLRWEWKSRVKHIIHPMERKRTSLKVVLLLGVHSTGETAFSCVVT